MEAVGQLTGGIANDFDRLLTDVVANLSNLQRELGDDAATARFLAPAIASARQGIDLAQRLRMFSHERSLGGAPIDVSATVAGMEPLLRRTMPARYRLSIEPPDAPLWVEADPVTLEGALINLAVNARDAMPLGGELQVRVTLALLSDRAAHDLELAPGRYAKLVVSDTGDGMDEATASRAFEPFFTTKASRAGGGLGLAMVYGFAKRSRGAARIESTPGHGTAATLWLPCVEAPGVP
jgi:signal transduction histidine kinase